MECMHLLPPIRCYLKVIILLCELAKKHHLKWLKKLALPRFEPCAFVNRYQNSIVPICFIIPYKQYVDRKYHKNVKYAFLVKSRYYLLEISRRLMPVRCIHFAKQFTVSLFHVNGKLPATRIYV